MIRLAHLPIRPREPMPSFTLLARAAGRPLRDGVSAGVTAVLFDAVTPFGRLLADAKTAAAADASR